MKMHGGFQPNVFDCQKTSFSYLSTYAYDAERLDDSKKSVSLVCRSFAFGDMAAFMKN